MSIRGKNQSSLVAVHPTDLEIKHIMVQISEPKQKNSASTQTFFSLLQNDVADPAKIKDVRLSARVRIRIRVGLRLGF